MKTSESIKNLSAAMLRMQDHIVHPKKTASNPHLRNKFADLPEVIDTTRPILSAHGLFVQQSVGARVENGKQLASVTTRLIHGESGEWVEDHAEMEVEPNKGTNLQQAIGSAHTYLRRYQWSAICGVASEPDDDGNEDKGDHGKASSQQAKTKTAPVPASKSQLSQVAKLIKDTDTDIDKFCHAYGVTGTGMLTAEQATDAVKKLTEKAKKLQAA